MHHVVPLKVHYYGTPVVLITASNPDGTVNLAPVSSVWWLNGEAMLGLATASRTTQNIVRTRECVLNSPTPALVDHVDRLALLTGEPVLSPYKKRVGYRYEPRKFDVSGPMQMPADLVAPSRVAECPIQLECELVGTGEFNTAQAVHLRVLRTHVEEAIMLTGTAYVDPRKWDPLIMKFCDFFGGGQPVSTSRLAEGWSMPGRVDAADRIRSEV